MARKNVPEEIGAEQAPPMHPDGRVERRPEHEHVQVLNPTDPRSLAGNLEGYRYDQARNQDGTSRIVPPPRQNGVVRSAVGHAVAPSAAETEDQRLAASLSEELEEAVLEVGNRQAELLAATGQEVVAKKAAYDESVKARDEVAARLEAVQRRLSPDLLVKYFLIEGEKEKRVNGDVMRPGKVIDSRNYDPRALRRAGVRLKEIPAAERDQY